MGRKNLRDLTIRDAFMFAAVMTDPSLCSSLLSRVLDMDILEVSIVTEKTLAYHPEYHGVRLDVLAVENGSRRRFNVEMQVRSEADLPKRSRYYHAQMDMDALLKGERYGMLPDSYVIFICNYDPVGDEKYRYIYRTICPDTGRELNDGRTTVLLSTKGKDREKISESLRDLLDYIGDPGLAENLREDQFIVSLNEQVEAVKTDHTWEENFMLLEELLMDAKSEGEERVNHLNFKLSECGREDEILKAAKDPEYQEKLFEEFGLE